MNVDPAVIYTAFGAVAAVVGVLWAVVVKDHNNCQTNLRIQTEHLRILTEHTIAQQMDIRALVDDRTRRHLPELELKSEKTEFFEQHMK